MSRPSAVIGLLVGGLFALLAVVGVGIAISRNTNRSDATTTAPGDDPSPTTQTAPADQPDPPFVPPAGWKKYAGDGFSVAIPEPVTMSENDAE